VGLLGAMSGLEPRDVIDGNKVFTEFKGALTGATVIDITESGDVDIAITGNEADYIYALNSEYGEVLVNGKPYKATVDKGTGANTIQVDVESGDIELNFL
jgi:hypothetical protein